MAGILLVLNSISSGVYAMELGGFDVTTGVDDVDDWSDWDEDGTDGVSENESAGSVDSVSGDTYGETENTVWEESSDGKLKADRKSRPERRTGQMQEIQK